MGIVVGIAGALAAAGMSASASHQQRKAAKGAEQRAAEQQALLEQQAREAEATAISDAKESMRLEMENRKRASTWKTRDEEEDDLGLATTELGSKK